MIRKTAANHYVLAGSGVEGTIDTSSLSGQPAVDVRISGKALVEPQLRHTEHGIEVDGLLDQVPDSHVVNARLLVPQVNVEADAQPFVGVALVTTARTSVGGPALLSGALHRYEVRPIGGTASAVDF